ncbi:39S ribosomal protein L37, mitochondrial [Bombina bombina]|uniref:39S ribosomal protein L37, mitochondrial n=1 Tax=Bombina bombina TaxID=8345 RepID=UPI00235A4B23|nr:39S ribosomal protein L37, mitochondrial [Bombina bombina]
MAAAVLPQVTALIPLRGPGFRCLTVSAARCRFYVPPKPKEPLEIPGLERITYADRQYYVPGLARPRFPDFERGWNDPRYYRTPPQEQMKLYKEQTSYVFNQGCRLLGGVKQALWLTKTKLIPELPQRIQNIYDDPVYQFPDLEERVHNVISYSCLWHSTEDQPPREVYCPKLLQGLIHLCQTQTPAFSELRQRSMVENCRLAVSWQRESTIYHVRGINGSILSAKTLLAPVASDMEIQATEPHTFETLYPLSPAIDLQEVKVYAEKTDSGFRAGYPFSYPHTVYLLDPCSTRARFLPDQLRAKMIMVAYGSALAKAKILFGEEAKDLPHPIVVQSIATDGQLFQFCVFQLNTLDTNSDDGIKNLVWMDSDQPLYDTALCAPKVRRKVVLVPADVSGFQPSTFRKFWAMYLHGAV